MPVGSDVGERDITVPQFYVEAAPDDVATKNAGGIPQFKDVTMVRIIVPGQRDETVRPVEPRDKERWPVYWSRFEQGLKHEVQGTPIGEFGTATEAEKATIKASGIHTVEELASLNDDFCQKLHVVALRNKAQKFLQTQANLGNVAQLQTTIERLEKQVKELTDANNLAAVSGRNADNGVHANNGDNLVVSPRRAEVEGDSKRGRKRSGVGEGVAKADV
jgi:hypothetical protein